MTWLALDGLRIKLTRTELQREVRLLYEVECPTCKKLINVFPHEATEQLQAHEAAHLDEALTYHFEPDISLVELDSPPADRQRAKDEEWLAMTTNREALLRAGAYRKQGGNRYIVLPPPRRHG